MYAPVQNSRAGAPARKPDFVLDCYEVRAEVRRPTANAATAMSGGRATVKRSWVVLLRVLSLDHVGGSASRALHDDQM